MNYNEFICTHIIFQVTDTNSILIKIVTILKVPKFWSKNILRVDVRPLRLAKNFQIWEIWSHESFISFSKLHSSKLSSIAYGWDRPVSNCLVGQKEKDKYDTRFFERKAFYGLSF
jgi:hypothetical protein